MMLPILNAFVDANNDKHPHLVNIISPSLLSPKKQKQSKIHPSATEDDMSDSGIVALQIRELNREVALSILDHALHDAPLEYFRMGALMNDANYGAAIRSPLEERKQQLERTRDTFQGYDMLETVRLEEKISRIETALKAFDDMKPQTIMEGSRANDFYTPTATQAASAKVKAFLGLKRG